MSVVPNIPALHNHLKKKEFSKGARDNFQLNYVRIENCESLSRKQHKPRRISLLITFLFLSPIERFSSNRAAHGGYDCVWTQTQTRKVRKPFAKVD